jgi:hypothetical protein
MPTLVPRPAGACMSLWFQDARGSTAFAAASNLPGSSEHVCCVGMQVKLCLIVSRVCVRVFRSPLLFSWLTGIV